MREKLFTAALFLWVFFAPVRPSLAAVMILPLVDLILALISAYRSKEKITSSGLKRTVAKIFLYEIATLLAFITETYLTGPLIPAIRMVTGLIGVTELKSCLEHLDVLKGESFFKSIISKLAPPQPPPNEPSKEQ